MTDKELAKLPGKLSGLLNQLTDMSKSPAKRAVIRARLEKLHDRMIHALSVRVDGDPK